METIKTLLAVFCACLIIPAASFAAATGYYCQAVTEEMPLWMQGTATGQRQLIHQYYGQAFELYKNERYARAIEYWDRILQMDPEQDAAKNLREEARKKLIQKNIKQDATIYRHISHGRYQKALDGLNALMVSDPSNPEYLRLQKRLARIKSTVSGATYKSKPWVMFRRGVSAYTGKDINLKLAYNALRYACELDPKSGIMKKILAMFESEYPQLAESEKITSGMTLLEFKRFVALNYIYDDKYHLAVLTCNEILAIAPNDILTLKRLGSAYYALGHKTRAKNVWKRAFRLAPGDKQLEKYLTVK